MWKRPPHVHSSASRLRAPILAVATLLALGCASARERLPALPKPSRPAWASVPDLPSRPAWASVPDIPSRPGWVSVPDMPSRPAWLSAPDMPSRPAWLSAPDLHWRKLPLLSRLRPNHGEIRGTVVGAQARGQDGEGDRIVVYLEPVEAGDGLTSVGATATVRQHAQRFSPAFLAVAAGQSVVFTNEDEIYHRIFSYSDANAFDTEVLKRGESSEVVLGKPGEVHFYCTLHPAEGGTLFVAPWPWFTTAAVSGAYRIAEVPPGQYRLRAWSEAGTLQSREVTVRAGASASVDLPIRAR